LPRAGTTEAPSSTPWEPTPLSGSAVPGPIPAAPAAARTPVAPQTPLAPSPGLVEALQGRNATPKVAAPPRLLRDIAVDPDVPDLLPLQRPIGRSVTQNAQLQADIDYVKSLGAKNIRVNQQQLTLGNSQRVGINRPDLQFDLYGRRYYVEYDTPKSGRGVAHQARSTANDANSETILLTVP